MGSFCSLKYLFLRNKSCMYILECLFSKVALKYYSSYMFSPLEKCLLSPTFPINDYSTKMKRKPSHRKDNFLLFLNCFAGIYCLIRSVVRVIHLYSKTTYLCFLSEAQLVYRLPYAYISCHLDRSRTPKQERQGRSRAPKRERRGRSRTPM